MPLVADGDAAVGRPVLEEGETLALALSRRGSPKPLDLVEVDDLLAATLSYWQRWIRRSRYHGRYREMVERSALTLKLLVHQPTGALVAAPTTSLPEAIGGTRNWDYRFTWVRDAAFTVYALMRLGFTDEAAAFMSWLEARCREGPGRHRPADPLRHRRRSHAAELTLEHLSGYRDSRPVRIGNGAADQLQLDIYGEFMDSVYLYNKYGEPISYDLWVALGRQLGLAREALGARRTAASGRCAAPRRRFTYSSLMTWVAFERAGRIAQQRGLPAPLAEWRDAADRAYLHVQECGWNPRAAPTCSTPAAPPSTPGPW